MGVAPEPPGDLSRVTREVVSVPSCVRLKDLIFSSTGSCALDFGSFMDPSSVGSAAELRGPKWAKERKKRPSWLVFPRWVESLDSPRKGEPSTMIFGVRG